MTGPVVDLSERRPSRGWWKILAVWTAAAVVYATVLHRQIQLPFMHALISSLAYYYSLAVLMLPVAKWAAWISASRKSQVELVACHIAAGGIVVAFWQSLYGLYIRIVAGPQFWELVFKDTWGFQLLAALTTYGAALGFLLTLHGSRRERDRERREASLLILARDAELAAIKAQIQPHFVLNALNSVLILIGKDPALARTMVVRLSELMRAVFEQFEAIQAPLQREIELTKAYLEVEKIRFGSRLSVSLDIEDRANHVPVPAFVLQPIVENAIKHGIALHTGPGEVTLEAKLEGGRLAIKVRNTRSSDPAPDSGAALQTGHGLQLTRRRLTATYGSDYRLTLDPDETRITVMLDLPAHVRDYESTAAAYSR